MEDTQLEDLLDEDACRTKELELERSTVGKCLHAMGMVQKLGIWVLLQLNNRKTFGDVRDAS